jgi:hypothetical protein
MNTKAVTILSWEEFAIYADEIERRRKQERKGYEKSLLLVDNYSPQKMGTSLATNGLRTSQNLLEQEQQNSMRIEQSELSSQTDIGKTLTQKTGPTPTRWYLSKELLPERPPTDEGWFVFNASQRAWSFFAEPPRLILPKTFVFPLN